MSELVPIPSPGVPISHGEPGSALVVLVHDWFGRLPWLENYAKGIAHQGYRVVVPDLFDGVACYATLGPDQHGVIPCPILLQFAEIAAWNEGEDPESFISRLKDHGIPVTEFCYLGTVHSFTNATISDRVEVNAATLAFAGTSSFLEDRLLT